ncbi:MAG: MMPL family transporter [Bdellovibrionales bacterium]|nr:MMPL family transporter [Bdellovibrionales bacterium]
MMKRLIEKCLIFFLQSPVISLFGIVLVTVPSVMLCLKLSLVSDFKRLLPQQKPSVVSLNRIIDKVGGIGVHEIKIECEDPEATISFIEALVPVLKALPEKYVRIVDYRIDDVKKYFEEHKYLYVDTEDLQTVKDRLKDKIEYEKMKQNPFFFDLEGEEVGFDISDVEEKYKSQTQEQDKYYKGYLFSQDHQMAVVLVHPAGATTGTSFSKDLVSTIDKAVQGLNPKSFHPSMNVVYGGKYLKVLSQYQQLIHDMLETLGLCLVFVALAIYLYFRRIRVIFLLTCTLAAGSAWVFALAQIFIGSLNSQTAFLGSIIVGNGVNSGVFLISRYLEERRKSVPYFNALQTAVLTTYASTFAAAITTSIAFIALSYSEIQGMSEFGFIGGVGMVLCWLASYTFLPAVLVLTEKYIPMHKNASQVSTGWTGVFSKLESHVRSFSKSIVVVSMVFILVCVVASVRFLPNSLEYDFSNLKNKYDKSKEEEVRNSRMKTIFGESLNPSIILLESDDQADGLCETVMNLENNLPEDEKTVASCKMLQDFVPQDQTKKMAILASIRALLADDAIKPFYKKHKKEIDELNQTKKYTAITLESLPETMKRKYQEKDGRLGRTAFVYSDSKSNVTDGKRLIQHTDVLTNIKLKDGSRVSISGDYPIFADLLKAIKRDGPIVSVMSFLFVALLIVLYFRNIMAIFFVMGSLILSVIVMFGIQSIFQIKLNFFNYIALPVTFGIGVDYAVNLYNRYKQEGQGQILYALRTTGGAIALCSITTMIGYLSLTQGINQAMVSFGWLAFIGEVSCVVASLWMIPACMHNWDHRVLDNETKP